MADARITFRSDKAEKFFRQLQRNVDDISEHEKSFWGAIGARALRDVIDHFEKESGPDGPWKSWSKVYAERSKKLGFSKKLQRSGRLRQTNMIAFDGARRKEGILIHNPAKIKKTGFPYALAHNEGGPILPQRKFMWLSQKAANDIAAITAAYVSRRL